MCGIAGYFSFSKTHSLHNYLQNAALSLSKRGPDRQQSLVLSPQTGFAHSRLSIIDTSASGNQPMQDASRRYTIIFNGEIFNFRELKNQYLSDVRFNSSSDTEVLLNLFIRKGKDCLNLINGFFALAIFDSQNHEVFLARDRFGIKPLHIYTDESMIVFASELKAILNFPVKKQIDYNSLALYLQLNYIPGNGSILKNIQKLNPAHFAVIDINGNITIERYYSIPFEAGVKIPEAAKNYDSAKSTIRKLVSEAVERRLVSDVPLGTFLSGGIDSSIVTACAAKSIRNLNTFSIGYKDDSYFDETFYANLVAKKYNTNHTVFSVSTDEMFENIFAVLDYIDEPFADSSSIAVYLLSKKTRQKVTVALSGDGGDEIFGGYTKHRAEWLARNSPLINLVLSLSAPLFKIFPQSRHSRIANLNRQLVRYAQGLQLSKPERYWQWCTLTSQDNILPLIKNKNSVNDSELEERKSLVLDRIKDNGDLNDIFFSDTQMVLPNDMLTKVDLMSMANSLEVRVPLLDYTVVDYAFSLPASFKINSGSGKRILKDAFREELPVELFHRPKQGFEVPLLKWLKTGLRTLIEKDLLSSEFIEQQQIFEYREVEKLKQKFFSANPGDSHAAIWSLLVFQYWYRKYFTSNA